MKISFIVINNPALASDRKRTGQTGCTILFHPAAIGVNATQDICI